MKAARVPVAVAQRPAACPKVACAAVAADKASACPVLSALQPLPGPHISHLEAFFTARRDLDEHRFRTWGGSDIVAGHYVGMLPAAFVAAPDVHREVMSQESAGALRPGWPVSARRLLGEESILVTGDVSKHKVLRKLVAPAVAPEAVEAYLPDIHHICVNTLEQWVDACAAGQTVKAMEGVKVMTLRIIASVVMDMQLDEEGVQAVSKDFNTWIRCFIHVAPHDVWPLPFHASMRARDRLVERIEKRLAALQQELSSSPASPNGSTPARHSTLRRLVTEQDDHGNTLSHQQVVDNLLTMLFAGHDTTASQLATLLYELAQHPQVLARVRAEQQQVVARHGPRMTPAALKDMKYTQAVLQEVFRSRPVVSATPRIATRDLGLKGYEVQQGQGVVVSIGIMMEQDPRWPAEGDPASNPLHPANFNPDRFMTEEAGKQGQQHPFGAGIRTCVGMALAQAEAKIFLATLARGYTYTADTGATRWKRDPLPRPQNGLPVFVQRLDASAAAVPGSA